MELEDKPTKLLTHLYQTIRFLQGDQQGVILSENSSLQDQKYLWKKLNRGFELKLANISNHVYREVGSNGSPSSPDLRFLNAPQYIAKLIDSLTCSNLVNEKHGHSHKKGTTNFYWQWNAQHLSSRYFKEDQCGFHRLVLPCLYKPNLSSFLQREVFKIKIGNTDIRTLGTTVQLDSHEFHLVEINFQEQEDYFLLIDSKDRLVWKDFRHYVFSIMMSYGFVSGYFPFENGYFFSYTSEAKENADGFAYHTLRDTLRPDYPPITTNPYSRTQDGAVHCEFRDKVTPLTSKQFSRLCYEAHHTSEVSTAILTFLEASCATLLLCVQGYFVILETLAHKIRQEEQIKNSPKLCKSVLENLRSIIDNADLSGDDKELFKNKINLLNQLPNQKKLEKIFSTLGLELTEEDREVVKRRNDYLHGRLFPSEETIDNQEENDRDLIYVTMRMCTSISALLLKYVGYSGWIINYPKLWEQHAKELPNELHFRKI